MTFNSVQFFAFFCVVLALYWSVRRRSAQNAIIVVASYAFYAFWDWRFLGLLAATTLIDFLAVKRIHAAQGSARRSWMIFSVSINLGVLAFFKYFNFFVSSATSALRAAHFDVSSPAIKFGLPIGISFYVFHEISYAIDVYRQRCEPEQNLLTYAAFIAFFPQLVAGPITRAAHMLPQFRNERAIPDKQRTYSAFVLILTGLFKKVVLADGVAPYVNDVFGHPAGRGFIPLGIAALGFSVQIYGDFAGYTDIARGVARLLGFDLARNFEQPYLSLNITEFWQRWHISLSSWLSDYLYVPLGGNRGSKFATYRNLMITMVLGGLWHGASWHFVLWGALNGVALIVHRARRSTTRQTANALQRSDAPRILATFTLVTALWVVFRVSSVSGIIDVVRGLGNGPMGAHPGKWWPNLLLVLAAATTMFTMDIVDRHRKVWNPLERWPAALHGALAGAAIVLIVIFSGAPPTPFIYFQF